MIVSATMKTAILAVLPALILLSSHSLAKAGEAEDRALVRHFCDALQAGSACNNVMMRLDTRATVEAVVGGKVGGPGGVHHSDCFAAMAAWDGENLKAYCKSARKKYGCGGTVERGLLQDNVVGNPKALLCKYQRQ